MTAHRWIRGSVLPVWLALALAACTPAAPPPRRPDMGIRAPAGVIILGVGPNASRVNLIAITPDRPPRWITAFRQLGVSWHAASGDRLVIATPYRNSDHVGVYENGAFRPLEPRPSYTPDLSVEGRLAYTRAVRGDGEHRDLVVVERDGKARAVKRLTYDEGAPAWGTEQRIAIVAGYNAEDARVLILDANTGTTRKRLRAPWAHNLAWAPGAPVAFHTTVRGRRAGLLDPDGGRITPLQPGWVPLAYEPGGKRLLATDGVRLALVDPATGRLTARLPGGVPPPMAIHSASWVSGGGPAFRPVSPP